MTFCFSDGPDRAILNPSNTSYSVNTNSLIPAVTCSADCNPPCDINWYKGTAITQTVGHSYGLVGQQVDGCVISWLAYLDCEY